MRGELINWIVAKGSHGAFGFIKGERGDVFVSEDHIVEGVPFVGATVEFCEQIGRTGRLQASDVRIVR